MTKDTKTAPVFHGLAIFVLLGSLAGPSSAEPPPSAELLECSIAFHDPDGLWEKGTFQVSLDEKRPNGSGRETQIRFDNARSSYSLDSRHYQKERSKDETRVQVEIEQGEIFARLNGARDFSKEDAERYRLTPERAEGMRNYYVYLYGLPMKLRDPGTKIEPHAKITTWEEQEAYEVKVTYDPEVGKDLWYFYFSPDNCALIGYRFHHKLDESDGENIYLKGLADVDGLRLPRHRTWYTVAEDRLLGTDSIVD